MTSRTLSKEKIVAAATELITEQENLTFTKLGHKLGIRSQGIYNYYPDVMAIKIGVAIHFYDELAVRLRADLLGLSGKQAIKAFANVCTQFALSKFQVSQQILSIPVDHAHDKNLDTSFHKIHAILNELLEPFISDNDTKIVISRMLRNLIIGEIVHVGTGRFNNKLISARDSFDKMLELTLNEI